MAFKKLSGKISRMLFLGQRKVELGGENDNSSVLHTTIQASYPCHEEGTFCCVSNNFSFTQGAGNLFDFRSVSDKNNFFLKADDQVIDETAIYNDWKAIGTDLVNVMHHYDSEQITETRIGTARV